MTARGIRNHNPGNIRRSPDPWQGLAAEQNDPEFFTFQTLAFGIRALARILITYQDRHGIRTIRGMIDRWAPPIENDTSSYIAHVAKRVGVGPDARIDVFDYDAMRPLVEAIIWHENGSQPYSDETLREGLLLAGIKPPVKPLEQSRTIQAGTVAATGTVASMAVEPVAELAQQVLPALPIVETVGRYAPWAIGVLVLAAIGYMVWRRVQDQKVRVA